MIRHLGKDDPDDDEMEDADDEGGDLIQQRRLEAFPSTNSRGQSMVPYYQLAISM
jgi:hypothetical protein